jgi:glycosyltransferase involved in cell wall biosynthesis
VRLGVVPQERIVVVAPGVELEALLAIDRDAGSRGELRRQIGAPADAFVVGVVGRLAEVKRPEWAFEVFALLAARHTRLQIVFVGDGDQRRRVERLIAELPDERRERVHLIGAVEDVAPVLAGLDAVLATSRAEGLPVALIEAAAAGLPVVATRVGGTGEIVVEERTGYLGETVDELAYGLDQLLAHPERGPAMGRRARVRVAVRHGADALADRLETLYRTVCEERRCAS